MTATVARSAELTERKPLGQMLVKVMTTTDHKIIGNLYFTTALAWWHAAFAAGKDDAPVMQPQLDFAKAFAERLPIVPLMFRSIRLWHPTNVRGVVFDPSGRPCFAEVFMFGPPTPNKGKP